MFPHVQHLVLQVGVRGNPDFEPNNDSDTANFRFLHADCFGAIMKSLSAAEEISLGQNFV